MLAGLPHIQPEVDASCPVYPSCAGNETCLYTECVSCPAPVPVTTETCAVDAAELG